MRGISLFRFIQLDNVEHLCEKFVSTPETSQIAMLETDQLRCNGSSNIEKIGYCEIRAILEIHFHSGGWYQYLNVPPFVFDGMVAADSVGKYYHQRIKGYFTCRKL